MSGNGRSSERFASVVVIGGGQAGLSAAYHLKKRDFASALTDPAATRSFVVLDAQPAPGGAWQRRWESLRMATVNGIFDLPRFPKPAIDPDEPSRTAVPAYFAAFERHVGLPILRPVTVTAVRPADERPDGELIVETADGSWRTREPRVHLVGFGPSQSTVGANRTGREAAWALVKWLDEAEQASYRS